MNIEIKNIAQKLKGRTMSKEERRTNKKLVNKISDSVVNVIDQMVEATFKIKDELEFNEADGENIINSAKQILKVIRRRSLEYFEEDRDEYRRDTIKKTSKVAEVIEVYSELIARGYKPAEAMVEIGEKITFDLEDKELVEYNFNKYFKEVSED